MYSFGADENLFLGVWKRNTKETLSTTDAKNMVASTLNMKSRFCFFKIKLIQFGFSFQKIIQAKKSKEIHPIVSLQCRIM